MNTEVFVFDFKLNPDEKNVTTILFLDLRTILSCRRSASYGPRPPYSNITS